MPRTKDKNIPFAPVEDADVVKNDPVNSRVLALFDALRKRGVGPERAAYCVSQVHANSAGGGAHPLPSQPK